MVSIGKWSSSIAIPDQSGPPWKTFRQHARALHLPGGSLPACHVPAMHVYFCCSSLSEECAHLECIAFGQEARDLCGTHLLLPKHHLVHEY